MNAFDKGRKNYRIFRDAGNGERTDYESYENPFDPDCTDYESFYDGWCHERDKPEDL